MNIYQLKFDLHHLRTFMAVAEQLGFRKAADRLHIAQPALSRHIAQLEEALGCQLFDRDKRRISLTLAGEFLYNGLPAVFDQLLEVTNHTQQIAAGRTAILRFGFSSAAMSSFLPSIVRAIQKDLDHCDFSFDEGTSDELIGNVLAKRLDAAFILYRPDHELLQTIPIKADRTGVILPEDHPLTRRKRIAMKELENERLILFPRRTNPVMYDDIIACCQKAGFSPANVIETAPRSTAIGLVAAGQGIATIAESLQHTCVRGTTFRPLTQPAPMINYSCVVHREMKGEWLDVLKDYVRRHLT